MLLPAPSSWDAVHPIIVHFPIGLLLTAPLLVVLSLRPGALQRGFAWSALTLLLVGTGAAFLAISSGQAARDLVTQTPEVTPVLMEHDRLAHTTLYLFSGLAVLYAALLGLPALMSRELGAGWFFRLSLFFLAAYAVCSYWLIWTGHLGGQLVHQLGVQAVL